MQLVERPEVGKLTTFEANRRLPVHRWLRYKEAFSRDLVWLLLDEMGVKEGPVLDPFCGSGTTLLACREKGIPSFGADVNPIALTASRAKVAQYDLEKLREERKSIFSARFGPSEKTPADAQAVKKFFDKETLGRLLFYRDLAGRAFYRDFFLLALANAAYECSKVVRDGAVLKARKKRFIPLAAAFRRNAEGMGHDLRKAGLAPAKDVVMEADARSLPLPSGSAGAVITSPPYLGIDDYTKAYAIENFVAGRGISEWLGKTDKIGGGAGETADAYFSGMYTVLKELKRVCRPGTELPMVMWDGFIGGEFFNTCEAVGRAAGQAGLTAERAWIVNRKPALVRRTEKAGTLRESVIFLKA